jgi:hypothetical protein
VGARCLLNGRLALAAALLCFVAGTLPAAAQDSVPSGPALQALLVRMQSNMARNGVLAEQYTSVEEWHNQNWDKSGKKTDDESAKYENVFVEGLPYQHKVEEDGKPLTGKAAAKEQQRYDKAVEERKHMTLNQKRSFFHSNVNFSLPLNYLASLFDNRVTGEAEIDGRKTFVVESTPKPGAKPANAAEKSALNFGETTWIDEEADMPVRVVAVVLKNTKIMQKGMSLRLDWELLPPRTGDPDPQPVWVQQDSIGKGWAKIFVFNRRVLTEETWSDYKKFQVDVRLLPDSVKMMTTGQDGTHP